MKTAEPDSAACREARERLTEAWLEQRPTAGVAGEHRAGCRACAAFAGDLEALAAAFAADGAPDASDALVHQTLERSRAELARRRAALARVPEGYRREVGRLLGASLLPLPGVLAWNAAVLSVGGDLLGGLVPASLLQALTAGYVLAGATWLACLYGSLPLVAHRRVHRRALEMAS